MGGGEVGEQVVAAGGAAAWGEREGLYAGSVECGRLHEGSTERGAGKEVGCGGLAAGKACCWVARSGELGRQGPADAMKPDRELNPVVVLFPCFLPVRPRCSGLCRPITPVAKAEPGRVLVGRQARSSQVPDFPTHSGRVHQPSGWQLLQPRPSLSM